MKKEDLITQAMTTLRSNFDRSLGRTDMESAFAAFCKVAAAELLGGGEVPLPGLGKLKVKATSARTGRNPNTGEVINIPAGQKVVFTPGKEFKEAFRE